MFSRLNDGVPSIAYHCSSMWTTAVSPNANTSNVSPSRNSGGANQVQRLNDVNGIDRLARGAVAVEPCAVNVDTVPRFCDDEFSVHVFPLSIGVRPVPVRNARRARWSATAAGQAATCPVWSVVAVRHVVPQTMTKGGCASAIKEKRGTDRSQPYALTTGAIEYDPSGMANSLPL
jgi:hypothetical protein